MTHYEYQNEKKKTQRKKAPEYRDGQKLLKAYVTCYIHVMPS